MNDTTEKVIRKTLALAESQHQNYKYSSKSELKRLCAQDPVGMAKKILELDQRVKVLTDELVRVKSICLRELGIGIVDENVLNQTVI